MRVLLLGSPNHDKIIQALRKERYLYDYMETLDNDAAEIPEGLYDVCILLADQGGRQLAMQLSSTLQQKVWGVDNEFAYNNIEVYLSLVRRKLRAIGSEVAIHAERGVGYYLET